MAAGNRACGGAHDDEVAEGTTTTDGKRRRSSATSTETAPRRRTAAGTLAAAAAVTQPPLLLATAGIISLGLGMRASLSPHGTPGGSSQGRFTPLSQLTPGEHRWSRVLVRVSRIWVASDPIKGTEFGLDSLLIDGEGAIMQARVDPRYIDPRYMTRLKQQLVEGKVYALSNFIVGQRLKWYMACRNGLMIYMKEETVVEEINDGTGSSIPRHSFEFVDFSDVPSRDKDKRLFTDVIGQVVSIEDEGQAWKWDAFGNICFRNICLRDLRGRQRNVALYGDLGRKFDAEQVFKQGRQVPVVAVFAGMLVQLYKGIGLTVRSTSASKYYLNLDIPEVQEFHESLAGTQKPIDRVPCQVQNPVNLDVLANSWRTIKELTSLDLHESQRTWFLCRATLKDIDRTNGWSYKSCFHCCQSISWDGSKPLCIQGCVNDMLPVERYKLDAIIEDDTCTMNVMIFDDPAKQLVGVAAEDLAEEDIDDVISAVISSQRRHAFVVAFGNGCFVVRHILNDDELQLLKSGSVHREAGGLSQDEGSSASCISNSQVKQEEMVIKQEVEADGDGGLTQEGSSASYISNSRVKQEEMVIKEEMEAAGGGELSQEEGSFVSCISNSQVKQEEMVIKEEMEAAGGGELSQEEGSSASYSSSPVKKLKR